MKYETPRLRWYQFSTEPLYEKVSHCGSDPLCRRGRARFSIVRFLGWPWTDNALDVASGRVPRRIYRACS